MVQHQWHEQFLPDHGEEEEKKYIEKQMLRYNGTTDNGRHLKRHENTLKINEHWQKCLTFALNFYSRHNCSVLVKVAREFVHLLCSTSLSLSLSPALSLYLCLSLSLFAPSISLVLSVSHSHQSLSSPHYYV